MLKPSVAAVPKIYTEMIRRGTKKALSAIILQRDASQRIESQRLDALLPRSVNF
jgi:hypothetical protein